MSDIERLTAKLVAFRDARDWKQFHRPKELAVSLTLEASELLELFQWKNDAEVAEYVALKPEALQDELADVVAYAMLLAEATGVDLVAALDAKIAKTALKYPVDKAKGTHKKYTQL